MHCINKSIQRVQTSTKVAHYAHIARIPDSESHHGDSDQPQILINRSLPHCKAILKISLKYAHNFLSKGQISDWTVSMVIQIATKILSLVPFASPDPSIKFHRNLGDNILSNVKHIANRQTNIDLDKQTNTTENIVSLEERIKRI